MKIKKQGAYANAVATDKGLFAANGAALLIMSLSKKDQDEFNGTKASKPVESKAKPKATNKAGFMDKIKKKLKK